MFSFNDSGKDVGSLQFANQIENRMIGRISRSNADWLSNDNGALGTQIEGESRIQIRRKNKSRLLTVSTELSDKFWEKLPRS